MKLSKTKKILLLGTTLVGLTTSIAVPIVLLNKDEKNEENDVEKIFKILQAKTTKEKIIELLNSTSGKIIANNQEKIIEKLKILIGKANLKDVKIEVLMKDDANISTTSQKIIIKLTKNEVSKEIEDFSVKKQSIINVNKDIESIKKILDAKTGNDLIIILPSDSSGNIVGNSTNKNAIEKELRILIDSSNTSGDSNHPSLSETTIEVSKSPDAAISTTPQDIIVSISKTGGTTVTTTKTFQVRIFTPDEDIQAIKEILDSKTGQDLIITLPSDSTGKILDNQNAIKKKLRILVDPLNINGEVNHESLRGTFMIITIDVNGLISTTPEYINILIVKRPGKSLWIEENFQVKKD